MNKFNVNINSDDVVKQHNEVIESSQNKKTKSTFDTKNYLQARLEEGVNEKTLTIRLLPFSPEGGSPFKKSGFTQSVSTKKYLIVDGR